MTVWPLIALSFGLGLSLGMLGGLLGIGGGLVAIPILAKLYGMNQQFAQGTALIMIVPNVLIGFIRYRQRNAIDLRQLASIILPAIPAAWLSSRWAIELNAVHLRVLFAGFLVCISVFLILQNGQAGESTSARTPWPHSLYPLLGVASGCMSGFFTVGGGLVVVPALVLLFGTRQTAAQGMALATVVPSSLVALLSYAQAGHVDWRVGLPLAVGGMLTVSTGVSLAHRFSPAALRWAFIAVLLATALSLAMLA